MATITKIVRPTGPRYKARIRRDNQPELSRTFKNRSDAVKWAKAQEVEIQRDDSGLTNEAQRHTFADAVKCYRRDILPTKSATTARPYALHLDYWVGRFGHLRLSEITPARIGDARDKLRDEGREPATVARYLATLGAVMTACVKEWHWLAVSPLRGVKKPKVDNGRTRHLSREELTLLLDACRRSESPDLYLVVLLSLTTGARQQELLGLRWKDADLQAGLLHLRVGSENSTKGGIRSAPIAPEALALLKARKEARASKEAAAGKVRNLRDLGLIFPARVTATKPVDLRTPWKTALRRAGIENFRWHDMRHSAASFLAERGASLLEIGAVLGHKSPATTKRYAHLVESHTHDLVREMTAALFGDGER